MVLDIYLYAQTLTCPSVACSGTVEFTSFPSVDGVIPIPQVLQIPNMYAREGTGSVCTMEWSSDGYVLAVGWEKGWAVWSVGGRCLAWGFGVEYEVDEERFMDSFMYGVRSLVSAAYGLVLSHLTGLLLVLGVGQFRARHASAELTQQCVDVSYTVYIESLTSSPELDGQMFVLPFAKSATTGQHSPVRQR